MKTNANGVETMQAARDLGKHISPLFDIEQCLHIALVIDGDTYIRDEAMLKIYDRLTQNETLLVSELIASYCDNHDIPWGSIQDIKICHYSHGKNGKGHFVVEGYIRLREF